MFPPRNAEPKLLSNSLLVVGLFDCREWPGNCNYICKIVLRCRRGPKGKPMWGHRGMEWNGNKTHSSPLTGRKNKGHAGYHLIVGAGRHI